MATEVNSIGLIELSQRGDGIRRRRPHAEGRLGQAAAGAQHLLGQVPHRRLGRRRRRAVGAGRRARRPPAHRSSSAARSRASIPRFSRPSRSPSTFPLSSSGPSASSRHSPRPASSMSPTRPSSRLPSRSCAFTLPWRSAAKDSWSWLATWPACRLPSPPAPRPPPKTECWSAKPSFPIPRRVVPRIHLTTVVRDLWSAVRFQRFCGVPRDGRPTGGARREDGLRRPHRCGAWAGQL